MEFYTVKMAWTLAQPRKQARTLWQSNDENCNGEIDEGYEDLGDACDVGIGACQNTGIRICASDKLSTVCGQYPSTCSRSL